MRDAAKRAVWDVLVRECDAREDMWEDFVLHWPGCREFRFQGDLGFGGKVYSATSYGAPPRVACYPEDETPARRAMIDRANKRLAAL